VQPEECVCVLVGDKVTDDMLLEMAEICDTSSALALDLGAGCPVILLLQTHCLAMLAFDFLCPRISSFT
jgi:hypothetical protein